MNGQPVIFFDGICNLCHAVVQFTLKRDRKHVFRFASLQSEYAQKHLAPFHIDPLKEDSFILLENGKVYQKSTAALRVVKRLSGLWPLLYGLIIIPHAWRDALYSYIAKHRYQWFGKKDQCWLPTPALREKFLD